jgi:hypothetical protein
VDILNSKKIMLVKKGIKNFNENDKEELNRLMELIYVTNFSLKSRWGWSLSQLKHEIAFAKFPIITNSDDDYGSTSSIIAKIKLIRRQRRFL